MRLPLICLALLAALPGPGHAGSPWTVADLGHLHEEAHCMEAAERSLAHAARAFGGGALRRRGWSVEATGLAGGGHDAVITCTFGDNRGVRATLALHSRDGAVSAAMIARAILDRFTVLDREITERWYEEIGVR